MRTRTRLAVGIAALLLCPTMPAGASSPKPVVLGATLTVTGVTSFVRDVTIPRAVHVTERDFTVTTEGGRFGGIVLDPLAEDQPGSVIGIREGWCTSPGCTRPSWGFAGGICFCGIRTPTPPPPGETTLPAGRYRLYLVADGARVTATVRLPGLKGRTAITSGARIRPVIDVPQPDQFDPPASAAGYGGNLYGAGSTHQFRGDQGGIYYSTLWKIVVGAPRSANPSAHCLFKDVEAPSFAAPCRGAKENLPTVYGQVPTDQKTGPGLDTYAAGVMSAFGVLPEGQWGLGGYIETAAPATEAHTVVFWLDLV